MKNSNDLIKKLTSDVIRLQNRIEHRNFYNIRNLVIGSIIKGGIAIDYTLPFIISSIIIANSQSFKEDAPFQFDEKIERAEIETIDTSSGIHLEHISHDFSYSDELIEHSTGWVMNDEGLYERIRTSYKLSSKVDLSDTEKILSMSKEEIDNILVITNIKTIKKDSLTPEDSIYNEDAIIVINYGETEKDFITRQETLSENLRHSIWYIVLVLFSGIGFESIKEVFIKTYIRDKLREYDLKFRPITKQELETMKKILQVKQENLAMISREAILEEESYSYKLRKL